MRVLAINDISCVGKCSITTSLPIISACGVECNLLPTALLSTHTGGFEGYTFLDLTDEMKKMLAHWKTLGLKFDVIYSGYLGSIDQIDLVKRIRDEFLLDGGLFVVDPVMGDGGKLYAGFTDAYVKKMRELCSLADYVLPNVTEACLLTDFPYPITVDNKNEVLEKLTTLCPFPVITGIVNGNDVSVAFTKKGRGYFSFTHENVQGFFHGAGDVFASAFVGCIANGVHEADAIYLSSEFVTACIRRSVEETPDKRFGLPFEKEIFPFLQAMRKML